MTSPDATITLLDDVDVDRSPDDEVPRRHRIRQFLADDRVAAAGIVLFGLLALAAIFAPWVAPTDPTKVAIVDRQLPPVWADGGSWSHVFGTDALGRDVLSATIYGARASLLIGVTVVAVSLTFGTLMGLVAGWKGGWVDTLIMRFADAQIAFPGVLLAAMVVGVLGPSVTTIVVVLALFGWMVYARLVRGAVLQLRQTRFVVAAELVGAPPAWTMRRHLLPNLVAPLLTQAMLELARVILTEASLSYLGLGIQPPDVSWGLMIAENQQYLETAWWSVVVPGLALAVTVLCANLVAASLRARVDPTQHAALRAARARLRRPQQPAAAPAAPVTDVDVSADVLDTDAGGPDAATDAPLLAVDGLTVTFDTATGPVTAVADVSLAVRRGTTLALVGESGSGKSVTAMSILGLLPVGGRIAHGRFRWDGAVADAGARAKLRGSAITLVNQEPLATLDPLMPVGKQLVEVLRAQRGLGKKAAWDRAVELLDMVGIRDPARRAKQYPWEFSGGMAQRAVIAMALAPEPELLIADEPTTALDVTIQAQILRLIADLQRDLGLSVILISHDLGVISALADEVAVMYAGRIVEHGPTVALFRDPQHPYTRGLLAATPNPHGRDARLTAIPGSPPTRTDRPGCAFARRGCPLATSACEEQPPLVPAHDRRVACWHAG